MISDRLAAEIATDISAFNSFALTRRDLTEALTARGLVQDQDARASVKRIHALKAARRAHRILDPLLQAASYRQTKAQHLREERRRQADTDAYLALPIAAHWRSDRRAAVAKATFDQDWALDEAIAATLEAVTRLARKWGFERRHTSRSSGQADSRYLVLPGVGEVRISDHEIPVYGERAFRYEQNGGPGWGEVIIQRKELAWSPTRWRRELILRAAGRR